RWFGSRCKGGCRAAHRARAWCARASEWRRPGGKTNGYGWSKRKAEPAGEKAAVAPRAGERRGELGRMRDDLHAGLARAGGARWSVVLGRQWRRRRRGGDAGGDLGEQQFLERQRRGDGGADRGVVGRQQRGLLRRDRCDRDLYRERQRRADRRRG